LIVAVNADPVVVAVGGVRVIVNVRGVADPVASANRIVEGSWVGKATRNPAAAVEPIVDDVKPSIPGWIPVDLMKTLSVCPGVIDARTCAGMVNEPFIAETTDAVFDVDVVDAIANGRIVMLGVTGFDPGTTATGLPTLLRKR
jgi:hypothetical protein